MRLPKPPEHPPMWAPTPGPAPSFSSDLPFSLSIPQPSKSPIDFSPPLIAMVVIAAAAFLLVTYSRLISRHLFPPLRRIKLSYRRWRCRHRHFPPSDTHSFPPQYDSSDALYVYSPYGLDDSVIKNIPLSIYKPPSKSSGKIEFIQVHDFHDCAVCLLDFEDGDYLRTLPRCYHSFHADCIDMWLRAHANCPLCRAGALFPPMTPIMAARIRPSLDESMFLEPLPEQASGEIQPDTNASYEDTFSPQRRGVLSEDHRFLLKRSHSFSFERSFASERVSIGIGAATAPHRHQHQQRRRSLWMKGASSTPFRSIAKSRVFSFRSRMMSKSPRHGELFPMSESSRSRRMKSPMTRTGRGGVYSSSRMRLGDPEALISPERYGRG